MRMENPVEALYRKSDGVSRRNLRVMVNSMEKARFFSPFEVVFLLIYCSSERSAMSFLAGFTGCCIGLCTKLYSNALRKLPYMRGRMCIGLMNGCLPACRAVGACSVYDCGRIQFLLRKEVYCLRVWNGSDEIGQREGLAA